MLGRPDRLQWRWVQTNTNGTLNLSFVDAAQCQRFVALMQAFLIEENAEGTENVAPPASDVHPHQPIYDEDDAFPESKQRGFS